MKVLVTAVVSAVISACAVVLVLWILTIKSDHLTSPLGVFSRVEEPPLNAYTFSALKEYQPQVSELQTVGIIDQDPEFTASLFTFTSLGKKVSGQINIPKSQGPHPVVIMIRGFADRSIYQTGLGTRNAAAVFARNGYITIAPDFLGYGDSDPENPDSFAARLEKPVTVLDLIASVRQLDTVDTKNMYLWGHSNGGQIALSILEITGAYYPTTLWAPVTKPFPYSILFYTDEYEDYGKSMRKALAIFENVYDVDDFSITTEISALQAPIQLHQGGSDDAVPITWSDDFVELVQQIHDDDYPITYYRYPEADHNLRPNWNQVVQRDLDFFAAHQK